ncbi:DUF2141 domain-containing protein [Prevotella sp. 10(H)]|uniref:DUF2141 domain-containing protein n=1 Tax=Prevotella sp. 10(H) TaxID=1158294 RepID=UPI0004A75444|nr:DUF2141 domain-containing protein [Prevotella sp. 10(H)]
MKRFIFILFLAGFISGMIEAQHSVTVEITGIKNQSGKLYIALFDSETPFLSNKGTGKVIPIEGSKTEVKFDDLKKGDYAITMFQDENDNGKLDLGEYGIPTEKYGFSNNIDPATLRRPPVFEECKFTVDGNTSTSINLVSAIKQ